MERRVTIFIFGIREEILTSYFEITVLCFQIIMNLFSKSKFTAITVFPTEFYNFSFVLCDLFSLLIQFSGSILTTDGILIKLLLLNANKILVIIYISLNFFRCIYTSFVIILSVIDIYFLIIVVIRANIKAMPIETI